MSKKHDREPVAPNLLWIQCLSGIDNWHQFLHWIKNVPTLNFDVFHKKRSRQWPACSQDNWSQQCWPQDEMTPASDHSWSGTRCRDQIRLWLYWDPTAPLRFFVDLALVTCLLLWCRHGLCDLPSALSWIWLEWYAFCFIVHMAVVILLLIVCGSGFGNLPSALLWSWLSRILLLLHCRSA